MGAIDEAIRLTVEYTRDRKVFGRAVLDNQVVHYRLAELSTELACLRALVWEAVERLVAGRGRHARGDDGKAQGGAPRPGSDG